MSDGRLDGLEIWLVGGEELAAATASACGITALSPLDAPAAWPRERRPDFLLVEGRERLGEGWAGEGLASLLALCERLGIPRLLWITESPFDPALLPLCPRFTRVFSSDRDHGHELRAAGAREPSLLWPGTALPVATGEANGPGSRPDPIVWLGGWRDEWPAAWQERLLAILEAARPLGLRIADPNAAAALPGELKRCVDPAPPASAQSALRRARVTIAADPASSAPHIAPRAAFDAIACGSAVVTPHAFATPFDFSEGRREEGTWRELVPVVADGETAERELRALLEDEPRRESAVRRCARIVANNHTHTHRIATLASAAGVKVVPEADANPAHR
jgi:Glycosyl transferases group 1